jgi:hypothetical protein
MDEGFSRQARQIFAGIILFQENFTRHGGKRTGQTVD